MKRKLLFGICGLFLICGFSSCTQEPTLEGTWLEPIPGMEEMKQGFTLEKGGEAASVNMATLQYEKWTKDGKQLILQGTSIGNGISIDFSDTLTIEHLTLDSLVLRNQNGYMLKYERQKP